LVGSVLGWSSPEGLKDGAYILSPFENRFVRLISLICQGFPKFVGLSSKVWWLLLRQRLIIYNKWYKHILLRRQRDYFIIFISLLKATWAKASN